MSSDKRRRERWKAHYYFSSGRDHTRGEFTVFEHGAEKPLGRLIDLTPEGLRIAASRRLEKGASFHLRIQLPTDIRGESDIVVNALCMWCMEDEASGEFHAGFAIETISPPYVEIIGMLIEE